MALLNPVACLACLGEADLGNVISLVCFACCDRAYFQRPNHLAQVRDLGAVPWLVPVKTR